MWSGENFKTVAIEKAAAEQEETRNAEERRQAEQKESTNKLANEFEMAIGTIVEARNESVLWSPSDATASQHQASASAGRKTSICIGSKRLSMRTKRPLITTVSP
jgi:D-hexose-6-phosphate mutarotase